MSIEDPAVDAWLAALEARHLADLRVQEVTRALRALSAAYVERRANVALDTAGKRAAFALFYTPLHFLLTRLIVRQLNAHTEPPRTIVDFGCGTGAAGAAWSIELDRGPRVLGVDRHPWAINEARWTYRQLEVEGQARRGDVARAPGVKGSAVVAAYVLNELGPEARHRVLTTITASGTRALIIEPIARAFTPWWDEAATVVAKAGGRADEWRFPVQLPPLLDKFDRAAGLDHTELTARTLYCPGRR